jgi:chitin disaccharide deacetylase
VARVSSGLSGESDRHAANPALAALGCHAGDRVVIMHADDVGMCEATVSAFIETVACGTVSSGSVMTPTPWCPYVASRCREFLTSKPDIDIDNNITIDIGIDIGVHLTLTSEWMHYRWRPLSNPAQEDGLVDESGYLHARVDRLQACAAPAAVRREIEAQIAWARRCGLTPTHVDSHMFAVAHGPFVSGYIESAIAAGLVPLVVRRPPDPAAHWTPAAAAAVRMLEQARLPVVDRVFMVPLSEPDDRLERMCQAIEVMPPGLTCFIVHPALDTPELRVIAEDWRSRVADYEALCNPRFARTLSACGVKTIGYGELARASARSATLRA